jgi:5-methylcytosine-specific restriction endonuclease McrA
MQLEHSALKRCIGCGEVFPEADMAVTNRQYPKSRSYCRPCLAAVRRASMRRLRARRTAAGVCEFCGAQRAYASRHCLLHWVRTSSVATGNGTLAFARQVLNLLERQGFRCALSGLPLIPGQNASLDHIVPRARGGTHELSNLQWVTTDINNAKWALGADEFIALCRAVVAHQAQLQCRA